MTESALKTETVDIDSLRTWGDELNPRRGNVESVASSLSTHGQAKPIVTLDDGRIVAGNTTWRAAKSIGWTKIVRVKFLGSEEQAQQFLLQDNKTSQDGTFDQEVLHDVLTKMMYAGQLEGTGYTADDVDSLLEDLGAIEVEADDFEGDFAASEEEIGERYNPSEHKPHVMFPMSFPADEAPVFQERVQFLIKAWGLGSARDAIAEAVKRAFDQAQSKESAAGPETEVFDQETADAS